MNVLMSILKGAGTFIDKIVPVAVGGRTKYAAILAAVVPFVKSTFPEYAPLLDHVQTVAIDLAALFGYAGLVR